MLLSRWGRFVRVFMLFENDGIISACPSADARVAGVLFAPRASWLGDRSGRQRSQKQSTETHGALLEPLWNLSENIHVRSLIVKTKLMHNFNDLMWWAHKDSNLGPAD